MLPQGMFSVAVATVLFPRSAGTPRGARSADARDAEHRAAPDQPPADPGDRLHARPRDADRPARLPARVVRPTSTNEVSLALFWFAFSLPFSGLNLLLTRTFFSLQKPWLPTKLAAMNMVVDVIVSVAPLQAVRDRRAGDRDGGRVGDDLAPGGACARGPTATSTAIRRR